jgi:PAS domain S-box-containing protein
MTDLLEKTADELLLVPEVARVVIENHPYAIVCVDGTGEIKIINKQAEFMFGYHRSEIKGQKIEILLPDTLKEKHIQHRTKYISNPKPRSMGVGLDLKGKRKDGTEIALEIELQPEIITKLGLLVVAVIRRKEEKNV